MQSNVKFFPSLGQAGYTRLQHKAAGQGHGDFVLPCSFLVNLKLLQNMSFVL